MSHNPSKKQSGKWIIICVCLFLTAPTAPTGVQGAPLPRPKYADPAIIDAGCEGNVADVLVVVAREQLNALEDKKIADLDFVRQQKDSKAWLRKNLRAERIEGTTHIQIGFRDGSPREQAILINAVVNYCLTNGRLRHRRDTLMLTAKRLKEVLDKLRRDGRVPDRVAHVEAGLKKTEETIEKLPRLVEHAKAH